MTEIDLDMLPHGHCRYAKDDLSKNETPRRCVPCLWLAPEPLLFRLLNESAPYRREFVRWDPDKQPADCVSRIAHHKSEAPSILSAQQPRFALLRRLRFMQLVDWIARLPSMLWKCFSKGKRA